MGTLTLPRRAARRVLGILTVTLLLCSGLVATAPSAAASGHPLSITMTASSTSVPSGSQLTYTIDVANTGGARVDQVHLSDQINGMTGLILTSTVGSCSQSANLVTCDAGSLDGFQSWQVTIRGTVTAADGETLHNTATVGGTKSSTTFTASTTVSTLVSNADTEPRPDLTLSIQGPSQVGEFADVTYHLIVNNIGARNASEITVVNTLPSGFSHVSAAGTSLFSCANTPPGSLTITCTGGAVNAGTNATITINATSGADPGPFENTAVVDPFNEIAEGNELNNSASLVTQKQAPAPQSGLTITKVDHVDPVRPGQLETYTIQVTNIADRRATNVAVVDGTQGLDAASIQATTTKGECTVEAAKVTCTQKSPSLRLDPGEMMEITITGIVANTAGSLITNTATVTGNIRNTGVTNTASTTTTVRPGVDLSVVQHSVFSHSDPPAVDAFRARDSFDYTVTVGNSGLDDATNVVVREPLPEGVRFKGFTAPAGQPGVACGVDSANVVTCTGLTVRGVISSGLPGGTVETIVLHVVAPNSTGTISATVTVDPANAILEADETNNTTTTRTPVSTGIDLTTMKTSQPVVAPSGTLVYTITVSNIGTQDTTGVVLRDPLPAGTRFREVVDTSDHNFTCSHDGAEFGGIVECVGGILRGTDDHTLPPDVATITITTFAPAPPGLIKNQVRVDPDGAIPEIFEHNNINTRATDIQIGGCCAYNEFGISKTQVSPAGDVAPNGVLDYDLTLTNTGSDVAFDVAVRDFMPEGSRFRFAQDTLPGDGAFSCTESGGVIECVGGTLDGTTGQTPAAGDSTRTIHVSLFAPDQPGQYTNQAIVDPGNAIPEADETNNSAVRTTTVALGGGGDWIDLQVSSMQASPDGPVVPNGTLRYTLTVRNVGTAVAFDVALRDVLPTGAVFRSATDTNPGAGAFTCTHAAGVVQCAGGTLDGSNNDTPAAGDTQRTIMIELFAPGHPGTYTNQAEVDPGNAIAENDETNNSAQTQTTVSLSGGGNYIDLVVNDIVDSIDEPSPGQDYSYTVKAENTGTDMATNVVVRSVLPPGVVFRGATGTGDFLCTESAGVVDCTGTLDGSLDQSPTAAPVETITLLVRAPMLADSLYTLQVRMDPGNTVAESNETNNAATETTRVLSKVDLQVTNTPGSLTSGQEGDWSFSVSASGADGAENFVVVTELPVGVVPLNVDPHDGWSCQIQQDPVNKVTCTGSLAANDTANFTVHVYVTAQGETVTSTTIADPDNRVIETTEGNNHDEGSASV